MRRPRSFITLLLLALWLPATLHCDLEAAAAELLAHDSHATDLCQDDCREDACETVEGVSFTKNTDTLRALPPLECLLLLSLLCVPVPNETGAEPTIVDPPEVQLLDRTWSFVRRAAPLSRAPSAIG